MVEKNKIYIDDCVDLMAEMPENFVDLVVSSPPYDNLRNYNGYSFDFESIADGLYQVMKEGGVVVWVVGDKIKNGDHTLSSFRQVLYFQEEVGFNVHDVMIYRKKNTPFMRSNAYTNCFEYMFVLSKGKPKTFNPLKTDTVRSGVEPLPYNKGPDAENKKRKAELKEKKVKNNIWPYAVGYGGTTTDKIAFDHPAVFPEQLAEDHILSWSDSGDLVFDPMVGSGTTCKMAKLNDREYIGCDISEEYVEIARERVNSVEE